MERREEIQGLRQRFGDIDEQAVRATMDSNPALSAEAALTMVVGQRTLANASAAAGEEAAQRVGAAARTETTANAGVVPTQTPDIAKTSWEGLDGLVAEKNATEGAPLLVRK